jgi:type IV secretion system protein VirD4
MLSYTDMDPGNPDADPGINRETELYSAMAINESAGKIAQETASRIIAGLETQEIRNILSNANAQTEWLRNTAIQSTMSSNPTFSFSDLKEKPTTVYFVLPPETIDTNKRYIRLFLNLVIRHVYKGEASKVPILMMIDEFPALGRMQEVINAFGVAAGFNLTLWPFIQDLSQMQRLYKDEMHTFFGNSRAIQVFSANDQITADFVSKEMGSRAVTSPESGKAPSTVPLRNPKDVKVEVGRETNLQYILRPEEYPLLIERAPYYKPNVIERLKLLGRKKPYDHDTTFRA